MEEKKEETITFETIREIQLREKREPKLIKLPENFYEKARNYLLKKFEIAKNNPETRFLIEARNVKRVIEDIFYQRERKIIMQAFIYIKTGLMPENMTPEEFQFFKQIVNLIKERRKKYIFGLEEVKEESEEIQKEVKSEIKSEEEKKEVPEKEVKVEESKKEEKIKETKIEKKDTKKILMKISLPSFLGLDGKEYGPFKEGEIVELPIELAELLIKKKAAEEYVE